MPRQTNNRKLAIERLGEYLDISLNPTGGGNYEPDLPTVENEALKRGKWKTLALLTMYAIEIGMSDEEIREKVNYVLPVTRMGETTNRYRYAVDKLVDAVGGTEARLLMRVYREEES